MMFFHRALQEQRNSRWLWTPAGSAAARRAERRRLSEAMSSRAASEAVSEAGSELGDGEEGGEDEDGERGTPRSGFHEPSRSIEVRLMHHVTASMRGACQASKNAPVTMSTGKDLLVRKLPICCPKKKVHS